MKTGSDWQEVFPSISRFQWLLVWFCFCWQRIPENPYSRWERQHCCPLRSPQEWHSSEAKRNDRQWRNDLMAISKYLPHHRNLHCCRVDWFWRICRYALSQPKRGTWWHFYFERPYGLMKWGLVNLNRNDLEYASYNNTSGDIRNRDYRPWG